jgi:hypothetical protein
VTGRAILCHFHPYTHVISCVGLVSPPLILHFCVLISSTSYPVITWEFFLFFLPFYKSWVTKPYLSSCFASWCWLYVYSHLISVKRVLLSWYCAHLVVNLCSFLSCDLIFILQHCFPLQLVTAFYSYSWMENSFPFLLGSAIGFRLDSLLKLTDTRARNNKMTLMHYLCKVQIDTLMFFLWN